LDRRQLCSYKCTQIGSRWIREARTRETTNRGTAEEHEKGSPNNGTDNSEVANWGAEENQEELLEYPARRRYSLNSRGHGPVFEKLLVTQLVQKFQSLTETEGS
jgi:hypothetical protein